MTWQEGQELQNSSMSVPMDGVMHCLGVRPDPGFRFGVGVLESGVGLDGASVSGLLHQLDFHIWYLVIGGGRVVGHDGEAVDSDKGDRHK